VHKDIDESLDEPERPELTWLKLERLLVIARPEFVYYSHVKIVIFFELSLFSLLFIRETTTDFSDCSFPRNELFHVSHQITF